MRRRVHRSSTHRYDGGVRLPMSGLEENSMKSVMAEEGLVSGSDLIYLGASRPIPNTGGHHYRPSHSDCPDYLLLISQQMVGNGRYIRN